MTSLSMETKTEHLWAFSQINPTRKFQLILKGGLYFVEKL